MGDSSNRACFDLAEGPKEQVEAPPSEPVVRSVRVVRRPTDAVAEPPLPDSPPSEELRWERFRRFANPLEAHLVAGRLEAEGIPAIALEWATVDLSDRAEVLVPVALMRRAAWVLAWPAFTDDELEVLAGLDNRPEGP